MSKKRLIGKTALITGGSSGIGYETAKQMVEEGAFVYITGRRKEVLEEAANTIGPNAKAIQADAGIKADMEHVFKTIKEDRGSLDIIFANAGIGGYIKLEDITEEEFDRTFNANVKGVLFTVQSMLPILSNGASVILNTSITANIGLPDFSVYAASKAAVRSFIHSWTTDFKDRKIRVNAVSPGVVPTAAAHGELGRSEEEEKERQNWRASLTPLGRVGHTKDISNAVIFLSSDESSYITGIELTVDGGLTGVFANKL